MIDSPSVYKSLIFSGFFLYHFRRFAALLAAVATPFPRTPLVARSGATPKAVRR